MWSETGPGVEPGRPTRRAGAGLARLGAIEHTARFTSGVASGDPTPTSVVVWTRVTGAVGELRWSVQDAGGVAVAGTAAPGPGGIVAVEVGGLAPGTDYTYTFRVDGQEASGRTATLPADPARFRLAVVSCARWASGGFEAYRRVAEARPDLVVHLGDYIYEDGGGEVRDHDPPHECVTAADYERRYAQYRSDPDLQRLHGAAPWVAIWDDHEAADDAWRWGSRGHRGPPGSWAPRREAAMATFQRWLPRRSELDGPTPGDRLVSIGELADVVLVDTRLAGRERPIGEADGPAMVDRRDRQLLTEAQWAWLDEVIGASSASWILLGSQVQVSPLRLTPIPAIGWPPYRWLVNPDQWDGYPAERERLLRLLDRHGRGNVLVLSGDLHARVVTGTRWGDRLLSELTTPSISAPAFATLVRRRLPVPASLLRRWLALVNPHIAAMDLQRHGATLLDVAADRIGVGWVDRSGRIDDAWTLLRGGGFERVG